MKPAIELTPAHVRRQVRIKDQDFTIEGTLSSVRAWAEISTLVNSVGQTVVTTTGLFIEVEFAGIDGTMMLGSEAVFEVIA